MRKTLLTFLYAMLCCLLAGVAGAQISLTGSTYTENFNFLPSTGSPTWQNNANGDGASTFGKVGVYGSRTGTGTTILTGTGSSNSGGLYSFGTDSDRALGSIGSSNAAAGNFAYALRFVNNTGAIVTSFNLSYYGEQWRVAATTPNTATFSYKTGAFTSVDPASALPAGYTAVSALDFTSPVTGSTAGALNGNLAANRVLISSSVSNLQVLPGEEIVLRWYDPDHTGADQGLSIDDVTITITTQSASTPVLTSSVASLTGFTYVEGAATSPAQSYTLSGSNLAAGPIVVTAPANYEVSHDGTTFQDTLTIVYSDSTLASTPVYVRLKLGLTPGMYPPSGTIAVTNAGGSASKDVTVSGAVSPAPTGDSPCGATSVSILSTRNGTVGGTFTITGRVTAIFSSTNIYIQDATGGILIYDQNGIQPEGIAVGDEVQVTGALALYNTEKELKDLTCFKKTTSANSPVSPLLVTAAEICNHQGELITLDEDVTITSPTGATFASANTNYTLSNSQIMRVLGTTNLAGATRPAGTFKPTGVVTIFNSVCQILPRSTDDVPGSTPMAGGSCGTATVATDEKKLDVTNWNVEWLGNTGFGPTNETTQLNNVKTVLNGIGSDVFMLEEVCSYNPANPADPSTSFGSILQGLNATFPTRLYAGECSNRYSYSEIASPDPFGQRVCIIYRTDQITKIASRPMLTNAVITGFPTGNNSQFWASGRLPFLFQADVKLQDATEATRINFIVLHAKSGSDQSSYDRRVYDFKVLYDSLQTQFQSANVIMGGDFNDDVDQSIAGTGQISSLKAFLYANPTTTNINDTRPNAGWNCVTQVFSTAGCASTASYSDFIDHLFVSDEISNPAPGGRTLATSVAVSNVASLRPSVSGYASNTSDHYPTATQYSITAENPTPVTWLNVSAEVSATQQVTVRWSTASERNASHFEVQRSKDARTFESLGTVKAGSTVQTRSDYSFADAAPFDGVNYYRLKQVDADGKTDYSRVASVEVTGTYAVSPNPVGSRIVVTGKNIAGLRLFDLQGRQIGRSDEASLEAHNLTPGTYLVEIRRTDGITVRRLIIKQ
ncbi:DUF5689 domain-containing protein [Siphonobacter aquaeclarae]|uniref:Por secretion system C-terminal sorting domain-containing protein n=1 Tax=Siphonobacter aquaeclarae TaxID=563176 RepID=A0A1G9SU00_9BACT|nr:DUF5689 domain-containing protein [Siphonobacter aquaeclarae]SDM38906.1 Por secretion system C-terminal sorting domain-containing protein [Siphonobacter aquaeclarae]